MSIAVSCSQCGSQLRVKDELAGRRGKCPRCQGVIQIPSRSVSPPQDDELRLADDDPPAPITPPRRQAAPSASSANIQSASLQSAPSRAQVTPAISAFATRATPAPEIQLDQFLNPAAGATNGPPIGGALQSQISESEKRAILDALQGQITPVKTTGVYRMAMMFVALVMLLLPMVYLGLIFGVANLMYYHATNHMGIMAAKSGNGRGKAMLVVVYLLPLLAGVVLIAFMVKPLFARKAKAEKPRSLTRDREPLLFAFVERLCGIVGAPVPKRIDVDCDINASASMRRGLLSVFQGKDLVLRVGLPLVAGLDLQQFTGVLAHEFGHFTQGWGMRLTYLIRSVNFWFVRVVYERDQWDEQLIALSRSGDYRVSLVVWVIRGCVWGSRGILWLLMMAGHAVCGVLLREMEFDADLYEMRMVGSKAFESTCRRLSFLGVATRVSYAHLGNWYQEGRLGDNLPRLIVANAEKLPPDVISELNKNIEESTAGFFDSHPSDRDRIMQGHEENAPGIFHVTRPATDLFSDFDALSKTLTFEFYQEAIGPEVKPSDLHAVGQLITRQDREDDAFKAFKRYFQNAVRPLRPLLFDTGCINPPLDAKLSLKQLQRSRQAMLAALADYKVAFEEFDKLDTHIIETELAAALIRANFKIKPSMFKRSLTNMADVQKALVANNQQLSVLQARLQTFEKAASVRIQTAIELLQVPQVISKLPEGESLRKRTDGVFLATFTLGQVIPTLLKIRNVQSCIGLLIEQIDPNTPNQKLATTIEAETKQLRALIIQIRDELMLVPYPLDHGHGEMSIAAYCAETTPPEDDLPAIFETSVAMLDRLPSLLIRMLAHLADAAEQVEKVVGLPPLAEPKDEEEKS